MKIMLDAGHGYSTPGKRSPDGMKEYEFNRAVASYTKSLLKTYENVTVYTSHSDNKDVPLKDRTDKANRLQVDCFVSIHANAYGSTWSTADGIETYVYITKPKEALELAQKVQKYLIAMTGLDSRGVKTADFHVLRETNMTAILVECGFMTNRDEVKLLKSETYRRTCAEAIVKGLEVQYNLKKKPVTKSATSGKGLYKVQAGAFSNRKNAEELAERLEKEGFETYIIYEEN